MRSVEFHPEDRTSSFRQPGSTRAKRLGSGWTSFSRFSARTNDCSSFLPPARRLAAGSGVFWFRGFPTASCIVASLSASTSWRSCTFTVDPATGGHGSEMMLPSSALQRPGGLRCSPSGRWAPAAGPCQVVIFGGDVRMGPSQGSGKRQEASRLLRGGGVGVPGRLGVDVLGPGSLGKGRPRDHYRPLSTAADSLRGACCAPISCPNHQRAASDEPGTKTV